MTDTLVQRVLKYHPSADTELIGRAYHYAEWAHRDQRRKSGEPYFVHPASVADIIAELKLDTASVCAGLLHDVVEDTTATVQDVEREFGKEIASLVDALTKLGKMNFISREDRQAENFRKMVVAMAQDVRVVLIKLCDRLDNVRTLEHMNPEARDRIARETLDIYAPLANRLGLNWIKAQLEDLSFRHLEPESYSDIVRKLDKTKKERDRYIELFRRALMARLADAGFAAEVSGRAKHIYSIHRKMKQNQCEFERIYDTMGFRLCVESVADCYAALGVVHSKWTPVPGRFKDYIALPKPNMYQSLHTTVMGPDRVRVEVQIRTHEMHRVAEFGVAAHWKYKERISGGIDPEAARSFGWLKEMAAYQRNLKDPAEFLESVKIDLFPDEVFVFTPKGDVHMFPRGATPIDFAYAIHTEVGHHCSGARANGQMVPLRYKLKNGDSLEIITSPNQHPSKDWLVVCGTTRARTRIRAYLREEQRQKSINLGREILENEMRTAGMSLARFLKQDAEVKRVLGACRLGQLDELLLAIGYGKLAIEDVIELIRHERPRDSEPPPQFKSGALETLVRRFTGRGENGVRVNGIDDVLVRYAKCCNPLPGDAIIGFITRGRGVTVHRRECLKAFDTDPERRIEVTWDGETRINRPVQVRVTTNNKPGILATVSQTFTSKGINISEANCRAEHDGRAHNVFTFQCTDVAQLKVVMRALAKLNGVVEVSRV